jgi:hypothetical protein
MTFRLSLAAATLAAGVVLASMPATAATSSSFTSLKAIGAAQSSIIEKTAGRCWWGFGGWHKWVPGVGRVQCTSHKCWKNRWGIRRCKWF